MKPETKERREPSFARLGRAIGLAENWRQRAVQRAIDELQEIACRDCYDDGAGGKDDLGCTCERCIASRALEQLHAAIFPVVRSLRPDRLTRAELVYFEVWAKMNDHRAVERSLLEILLDGEVSQRDMDVASAIVQWLGTNVGRSFVNQCELEATRQNIALTKYDSEAWLELRELRDRSELDIAVENAAHLLSPDNKGLKSRLKDALKQAIAYGMSKGTNRVKRLYRTGGARRMAIDETESS